MDMETFMLDNSDNTFFVLVYKRIFTPYENEKKFMDESIYEESFDAKLVESISLGNGDYLLGFRRIFDSDLDADDEKVADFIDYYKLSEIRLTLQNT